MIDIEKKVLGALMLDMDAYYSAGYIHEGQFTTLQHQEIFRVIENTVNKGQRPDLITVNKQINDKMYLSELLLGVNTWTNLSQWVLLLEEEYKKRGLSAIGERILNNQGDIFEDIENTISDCYELLDVKGQNSEGISTDLMKELSESLEEKNYKGIQSGLVDLDNLTGGFHNGQLVIIAGRPGMGKCLKHDTPVLMFDGSIKQAKDVMVGDQLMGPDSKPRNVLNTTSGSERMYDVIPKKGMVWGCNESHVLSLVHSTNNTILNISVKDYFGLSKRKKHQYKLYRTGVEFGKKEVPFHPYVLGLWLGDGTRGKPQITNSKEGIHQEIRRLMSDDYLVISKDFEGRHTHSIITLPGVINPFKRYIEQFNDVKYIPTEYLINDRETRLDILAGIIDTDGHLIGGCFEVVNKYEGFSNDLQSLCRSLGFHISVSEKWVKLKGWDESRKYYRHFISGDIEKIPTRFKKAKPRKQKKNVLRTGFDLIDKGVGDYCGFSVDGDNLFLLGDTTVTHNSSLATTITLNCGVNTAIFSLEMTKLEVMSRMVSAKLEIPIDSMERKNVGMNNRERIQNTSIDHVIINDTPGITINQLRMTATKYKKMYKIKMLVVDYIQLMQGGKRYSGNRLQEVGEISRGLKQLAKELDIPVIALSQLARSAENEPDKKPKMRHLRESGEIEQDANVVMLLWSPEYYGIPQDSTGAPYPKNHSELIIAKNRNGKKDTINLRFLGKFAKFTDSEGNNQLPEWV